MTQRSSVEARALALLGQNIEPALVASATGVTVSRISQLISDPEFSAEVAELRFQNVVANSDRDKKYDSMEDALLDKLKDMLCMMTRPLEVIRAISVISAVKRRGPTGVATLEKIGEVVQINMPTVIHHTFITNINKQVIKAGQQDLLTVQSAGMQKMLELSRPGAQNETSLVERIP